MTGDDWLVDSEGKGIERSQRPYVPPKSKMPTGEDQHFSCAAVNGHVLKRAPFLLARPIHLPRRVLPVLPDLDLPAAAAVGRAGWSRNGSFARVRTRHDALPVESLRAREGESTGGPFAHHDVQALIHICSSGQRVGFARCLLRQLQQGR